MLFDELVAKTDAAKIGQREGTNAVHLTEGRLRIRLQAGIEEENGNEYISFTLAELPIVAQSNDTSTTTALLRALVSKETQLEFWYVDVDDQDYGRVDALLEASKRNAAKVHEKIDALTAALKRRGK